MFEFIKNIGSGYFALMRPERWFNYAGLNIVIIVLILGAGVNTFAIANGDDLGLATDSTQINNSKDLQNKIDQIRVADIFFKNGQFSQALVIYNALFNTQDPTGQIRKKIKHCRRQLGQWVAPEDSHKPAIMMTSANLQIVARSLSSDSVYNLYEASVKNSDYRSALIYIEWLAKHFPDHPEINEKYEILKFHVIKILENFII